MEKGTKSFAEYTVTLLVLGIIGIGLLLYTITLFIKFTPIASNKCIGCGRELSPGERKVVVQRGAVNVFLCRDCLQGYVEKGVMK